MIVALWKPQEGRQQQRWQQQGRQQPAKKAGSNTERYGEMKRRVKALNALDGDVEEK